MEDSGGKGRSMEVENQRPVKSGRQRKIIAVASIAAGVQFGWALQLSLLTPYVQLLGIPHKWAALIWLCGPVSGMIVQPLVGYYSDRCTSRWGRRRPFIGAGTALVALAVFLIGYAADFGKLFGDDMKKSMKPRAVIIFVIGFWILDVANNMLQGPCRALLADLSSKNTRRTRAANSFYSFFMAVGNVLGYGAGSLQSLHKMFPFARTQACDVYCANLKSCFFLSIALLFFVTITAFWVVQEKPLSSKGGAADDSDDDDEEDGGGGNKETVNEPFFGEIVTAFKNLPKSMRALLLVTCLNWIGWFPFILYDTDWMGKEVYGGTVGKGSNYDDGVRAGSLGLTINSVVLGFVSLAIDPLSRTIGVKRLWGGVNFVLAACLALTVLVTKLAEAHRRIAGDMAAPTTGIKVGALLLFSALGIPLAVTYSIPFALASIFSNTTGAGQGLSLGVLNVSIVIPQMVISVLSGPWDSLFGGGNLPAFVVGAVAAAISGLLALTLLPSPPPDQSTPASEGSKGSTAEAPR